ncbi:MAG TPA: hypothetical protein VKK81_28020 [Candidatus Binatia bacterium]|nr:hypothetical protein [Candidatus Binatia bacterium]
MTLCLLGWLLAGVAVYGLVHMVVHLAAPLAIFLKLKPITLTASLMLAVTVGVLSAIIPSYCASHVNIVQGLRHIESSKDLRLVGDLNLYLARSQLEGTTNSARLASRPNFWPVNHSKSPARGQ